MSAETQFEAFWTALANCPYDLPQDIKPHLMTALKDAGFFDAPTTVLTSFGPTVTKTKKLSGYNIFMREKMPELKEKGIPGTKRMGEVSVLWKSLSDEEKGAWKTKANSYAPSDVTIKAKSEGPSAPKKLSGYQLYVKETMPVVKANLDIPAKGRMSEIGKMWRSLEQNEKDTWKIKAQNLI
jgi:hypothetical protein